MEMDLLKSTTATEDDMDMMMMMMQMEKLPEFYGSYNDVVVALPPAELPQVGSSPLFINQSYAGSTPVEEPGGGARGYLCSPNALTQKKNSSMAAMREMMFRIAAMQPINTEPESVKPPKRRNVKISKDPQSVAARHRRERISEKIRTLQRLVPGGTKMDTASMLDEAIHYVKFLKTQVQTLERTAANRPVGIIGFPVAMGKAHQPTQNLSIK